MLMRAIIHDEGAFTPEEAADLVSAFEITLQEIGLANREDPLTLMIAKQIIAVARSGERDPGKLSAYVIAALRRNRRRKVTL
jgi:hypothetical protein